MKRAGKMSFADTLLWKYGTRYGNLIKKIPFLRDAAEKKYWRLNKPWTGSKQTAGMPMLYLGDYRALTRTVFGHKMFVDTRDVSITPHICLDGFWESHITRIFDHTLKGDMTVLEIGANIGYYSVLAASRIGKNGKIYCFEANPDVFELLRQNISVNGFLDRAVLINKAVSSKSGRVPFHSLKKHRASGSIAGFSREFLNLYMDESTTTEMDAISVDEYFADNHEPIDVIKMDAEGSEALIFKGMKRLLANNPDVVIICEFAPDLISATGEDPEEFLRDISRFGFHLRFIDEVGGLRETSIENLLMGAGANNYELFLKR